MGGGRRRWRGRGGGWGWCRVIICSRCRGVGWGVGGGVEGGERLYREGVRSRDGLRGSEGCAGVRGRIWLTEMRWSAWEIGLGDCAFCGYGTYAKNGITHLLSCCALYFLARYMYKPPDFKRSQVAAHFEHHPCRTGSVCPLVSPSITAALSLEPTS